MTQTQIIALIPARGGSKGIPRKNIREFGGKPLISWTIEAARKSRYLTKIVVSSDDADILTCTKDYPGVTTISRPPSLATDTATTADVIKHVLGQFETVDILVLLQPTSPLRLAEDIDAAIEVFLSTADGPVVSVALAAVHPQICFRMDQDMRLEPMQTGHEKATRRQDLSDVYALNGAIYIAKADDLAQDRGFIVSSTRAYVMPADRSIDIDTPLDFDIAEFLLLRRQAAPKEWTKI